MATLRKLTYQYFTLQVIGALLFTVMSFLAPTQGFMFFSGGLALFNWVALAFMVGVWFREQRSLRSCKG